MLMENPERLDQKLNSWHLITSQMLVWAVPFDTPPSVIWALGTSNLLPAQPRDRPLTHFPPVQSGLQKFAALPKSGMHKRKGTRLGLSATAEVLVKYRGRRNKELVGLSSPSIFCPQKKAWHNSYIFQEIQDMSLKSEK